MIFRRKPPPQPGVYDAIVIGGGHNGLICAAYLAKAGRRTIVLEATEALGGLAAHEHFLEDFSGPIAAHRIEALSLQVARDLSLQRHGLKVAPQAPIALLEDGRLALLAGGLAWPGLDGKEVPAAAEIAPAERLRLDQMQARLARAAASLRSLLEQPGTLPAVKAGIADELAFFSVASVSEILDRALDNEALKSALAMEALAGANAGVSAPGSALVWLLRLAAGAGRNAALTGMPVGGMAQFTAALRAAAIEKGAELRTEARVNAILLEDDRVAGVALANGEVLSAPIVASSLDAKATLLGLIGARHLDTGTVIDLRRSGPMGRTGKVTLALTGLPPFSRIPDDLLISRILIPGPAAAQGGGRAAKRDAWGAMALEILLPSLFGVGETRADQHVLSVIAYGLPEFSAEAWEAERATLMARVLALLEEHAPGLNELVLHGFALTPADIEARWGTAEGHWHGGEPSLHRVLEARPQTVIEGLYLCGLAASPMGGITGLPGRNAARAILNPPKRR